MLSGCRREGGVLIENNFINYQFHSDYFYAIANFVYNLNFNLQWFREWMDNEEMLWIHSYLLCIHFCFSIVLIGTFLLHVKLLFCCLASYWVINLMKLADFNNNKDIILINTITYLFWTIELNYLTKFLW